MALVLVLTSLYEGMWIGVLFLFMALSVFMQGALGGNLPLIKQLIVLTYVLAVPAGASLTSALLDRFATGETRPRLFQKLLLPLSLYLMLSLPGAFDYLEHVLHFAVKSDAQSLLPFFLAVSHAVVFCSCLTVFTLTLLELTFELPVLWLEGSSSKRIETRIQSLRPLILVMALCLCFNLLLGLLSAELRPLSILQSFMP